MVANATSTETETPRVAPRFGKPKPALLSIFDRQRRQSLLWFVIAVAAWADRGRLADLYERDLYGRVSA